MIEAHEILRRFEKLAADRASFESTWQEIADFEIGRRDFSTRRTPGQQRMQRIYDTTALESGTLLSAALHALLTNMALKWFRLKLEDESLMKLELVPEWLEYVESVLYAAFNHPDGNFAPQIHEVYNDVVWFGTGAMYIADDPGRGVTFSSRPLGEIFVAENSAGRVDTVFRKFPFTNRQAVLEWGKAAVPKAAEDVARGKPDETRDYLHFVCPRVDPIPNVVSFPGMAWQSYYVSIAEKQIVSQGGYHEMPYMVARWSKDSGETYGRSPGWQALSDAKMLNEMGKVVIQAGQLAVAPPLKVADDGVLSNVRIAPWSLNTVRADVEKPIEPIWLAGNIPITEKLIEIRQEAIKRLFFSHLLPSFAKLNMTATEVMEVAAQAQRMLSPTLGRMHVEILDPMLERVFQIERRNGRIPDFPYPVQGNISVDYVSPVAMAQKSTAAKAILDTYTIIANLSQVDPSVLHLLNSDAAARLIAEAKGAPTAILRSEDEVEEIREAERQLARERQLTAESIQTAESAAKLLPAVAKAAGGRAA